jgi:hypothetical protein
MNQDTVKVHVEVDGKTYVVRFNLAGGPLSIKERRLHALGLPWECWHESPCWHHSKGLGGPKTRPQRILAAARQKAHIPNDETKSAMLEAREMTKGRNA